MPTHVRVLGPVRVVDDDGVDRTPVGALQRKLLALLLLRRGAVVPADVAIDVLWSDRLPDDPAAALQNHVSRLRRELPADTIESVGNGYRLRTDAMQIDVDVLARAVAEAPGGGRHAADELATLIAEWHGPAYPELVDLDDGRAEGVRLEELRIRAREVRTELRLDGGDVDGVIAEVVALVDDEPLRERPRSLLMTALAASGRRVEALRAYDDFRRLLAAELGIEPSAALAAQHADLLGGTTERVAPTHRIPAPPNPLHGRDAAIDEIVGLAARCRLITLVGPGGVGKTRLVIAVGHRLVAAHHDRPVVFCPLSTATADSIVDVVAAALGVDARPGVSLVERVAQTIGTAACTLLLDNCEHVLDGAAAMVDHLIGRCANVVMIATSRERLRVAGEQLVAVSTLPWASVDDPAQQLFIERARAVVPGFDPDEVELRQIAEIVRRLDGLPLAIELAAARLLTHDVEEVASGLDERFALLSSGYRGSTRHGSLRAAVSWSFELLDGAQQRTFASLSVFAGSFDVDAAAAVCDLSRSAADGALAELTERSLVVRTRDRRFVLLETLRAFGAEQLTSTGRADVVAERHALHQVRWTGAAQARLATAEPVLRQIDEALPELRAALTWLLAHDGIDLAEQMLLDLQDYSFLRLRPDVFAWAEPVTGADVDDLGRYAAETWIGAAYASWMAGDLDECARRTVRSRLVADRSGAAPSAKVLTGEASLALFEGRLADAAASYRAAADVARPNDRQRYLLAAASELLALGYGGDPAAADRSTALLADVGDAVDPYSAYAWYCAGESDLGRDDGRARQRLAIAVQLAERTHASLVTGVAGASKASLDARFGDPLLAAAEYRGLIDHWRRSGMWATQWTMLRSIAALLARLGRYADAAVIEGAVRGTAAGHRIFGADAIALDELSDVLRAALGADRYESARAEGASLDGDAAAERARAAL